MNNCLCVPPVYSFAGRARLVQNGPMDSASSVASFESLDRALRETVGHKLLTVVVIDSGRALNRRVYTSDPAAYPCGGTKPLRTDSAFYRTVVLGGAARLCATREQCREAFPDFAIFEALGCASAVNVPVRSNGVTLGSINLLHEEGWYRQDMLGELSRLASWAVPLLQPHVSTQE